MMILMQMENLMLWKKIVIKMVIQIVQISLVDDVDEDVVVDDEVVVMVSLAM